MIKNPLKMLSKGVNFKSLGTKFGILSILFVVSMVLVFIAGVVALVGTFLTNIK